MESPETQATQDIMHRTKTNKATTNKQTKNKQSKLNMTSNTDPTKKPEMSPSDPMTMCHKVI